MFTTATPRPCAASIAMWSVPTLAVAITRKSAARAMSAAPTGDSGETSSATTPGPASATLPASAAGRISRAVAIGNSLSQISTRPRIPRSYRRRPKERPLASDPRGVRLNRRGLLVGAAGMVAQTNLLAGAVVHAATRPSYTWSKGAMDGGGYCNAMATDPLNPGCAAAAGDVWGEFATRTGGNLWYPTMTGATSIGAIYGRAVAYSRKAPGLRYFGIGVLKDRDPSQGYLGAVGPHSLTLERRNEHVGFSTYLPVGNAHDMPRAVGSLIAVDYDA